MKRYTIKQCIFIVDQYFKNYKSFSNKIFSDEVHFHLDRLVNRQNRHILENQRVIIEKQMHSHVTDFRYADIIGSNFT